MGLKVRRFTWLDWVFAVCFILLVVFATFPLLWMLLTSFKNNAEINKIPPTFFPKDFFLGNYAKIFQDPTFVRYFLNSVVVASITTVLSVSGSMVLGYLFAKFRFPGKELFFSIILASIMIPFEATVVPLYMIVRNLHGLNTYFGLIFPSVISSFGVFFIRSNMSQLPDSLIEAARIDGASNWYTMVHIAFPLEKSAVAVLATLMFLDSWGSYLWPLLISTKPQMYVLEIGLTLLQNEYITDYGTITAGCTVALVPAMIIFIIFRSQIMEGIATSGMKN